MPAPDWKVFELELPELEGRLDEKVEPLLELLLEVGLGRELGVMLRLELEPELELRLLLELELRLLELELRDDPDE